MIINSVIIKMNKVNFKLFKTERNYGDNEKYKHCEKIFVFENENMNKIIEYLVKKGDKSKSYIVLKYMDDLRWRQLGRKHCYKNGNLNYFEKGDLTTTWARFTNKNDEWKETNYRYASEIV